MVQYKTHKVLVCLSYSNVILDVHVFHSLAELKLSHFYKYPGSFEGTGVPEVRRSTSIHHKSISYDSRGLEHDPVSIGSKLSLRVESINSSSGRREAELTPEKPGIEH